MAKYISDQYFSVEFSQFKTNETLPFALYLYLPLNNRIILLRTKGDILEQTLVDDFLKKKIKNLHLSIGDEQIFKDYLLGDQIQAPPTFESEIPPEDILADFLSAEEESQKKAKETAKTMLEQVLTSTEEKPEHTDDFVEIIKSPEPEHATSVATYSVLFAMGVGYKDATVLQDLTVAGLLHDMGLTQVMPELVGIPATQRTLEQTKLYEKHVEETLSLLTELGYSINERTRQIIGDHHEKFDGTGFPRKLQGFKVGELAQIISLADMFDNMMRGWWDGTVRTLDQAVVVMSEIEKKTTFPHYLNPDLYRKIIKWIAACGEQDSLKKAEALVMETQKIIPDAAKVA